VDLYNRYHRYMHQYKGWPLEQITLESYTESFVAGGESIGRQWLYFDDSRLVGVALMDEVPDAISLVYCYHDPEWRPRSPGTFSILTQLEYARSKRISHAYLGYWIKANPSMNYKARFRPHEILREYPCDGRRAVWEQLAG
jgi:arginine-tRNA-protein transferase